MIFEETKLYLPHQSAIREVIAREDIDIHALVRLQILWIILLYAGRIVSPQFGVGHWPMSAVFLLGKI